MKEVVWNLQQEMLKSKKSLTCLISHQPRADALVVFIGLYLFSCSGHVDVLHIITPRK